MVRSNQPARRGRRNARLGRTSALIRRVEHSDIGVEFVPTLDPPDFSPAPWWPITVPVTISKQTIFTWKLIHDLLLSVLGLTSVKDLAFNMRAQTVRMWGTAKQPITMEIFALSSATCRKIKQISDRGTPIHYSRLGWRFGRSSFAMLDVGCGTSEVTLFTTGGKLADDNQALIYLQLLIQVRGVPITLDIPKLADIVAHYSATVCDPDEALMGGPSPPPLRGWFN